MVYIFCSEWYTWRAIAKTMWKAGMHNMNFLNKMERKFGKYAISNLSLYLILGYVLGYVIQLINPVIMDFFTLNPYLILHGQIWRLVTWIIIPPSSNPDLLTIIMLFFYYSIGTNLERTWGTFYTMYIYLWVWFLPYLEAFWLWESVMFHSLAWARQWIFMGQHNILFMWRAILAHIL